MADNKPQSTGADFSSKIVAFPVDAASYAERAIKALERLHYDKALTYFRKAVECEPDNPIHQCNLAGALAESGQFEESNRILAYVVQHIDPEMADCYYYMANNCAYLDQFQQAEELLHHYLKQDPYGTYAEEAQEMLTMLLEESSRPGVSNVPKGVRKQEKAEIRSISHFSEAADAEEQDQDAIREEESEQDSIPTSSESDHEAARLLLEEGKFVEAERLLLHILEQDPDYLAARNNLALAYYYMGRFDEARETLEGVLQRDAGNLHALCNLAIFEQHANNQERVVELIQVLSKTEPFHQEHAFKLATTMGILGEHGEAYRHLKRLVTRGTLGDASVYHYAAVAACHNKRYDEATRWWATCRRLDPQSGVAAYYLEQLQQVSADGNLHPMPTYHYRVPYEEERRRLQQAKRKAEASVSSISDVAPQAQGLQANEEWEQQLKKDPLVRSSLFWALRYGETTTKLQALQAMHMLHDEEAMEGLRNLLLDPAQEPYIKQIAFYLLRKMGVKGPIELEMQGDRVSLEGNHLANSLPEWQDIWQKVLNIVEMHMEERYNNNLFMMHDAQTMWIEFLTEVYPDAPKLQKAESWSAALEFRVAKLYQCDVSMQQLAERYGVSAATISKHVKRMEEVSHIQAADLSK